MPRSPGRRRCKHCRCVRWQRGRGLCVACHKDPEIRCQYANLRGDGMVYPRTDPTAEEVERIVAEQMAKPKPKWWALHETIERNKELPEAPPRVVKLAM